MVGVMTAKDMQLIADVLRYDFDNLMNWPDHEIRRAGCQDRANRFAVMLAKNNPRFDRQKFMAACGFPY